MLFQQSELLHNWDTPNAVTTKALTRKSGFSGVDGIFRFTVAGTNQRGLAIAQISDSQVNIIDDAPQSFNRSGM